MDDDTVGASTVTPCAPKAASDAADEAARLDLPCLERDLQLVRASLLVAQGRRAEAQPLLTAASMTRDTQEPSIGVLFAQRALAQLTAGTAAAENVDTSLITPRPRMYEMVGSEEIEKVWKEREAKKKSGESNGSTAPAKALAAV